MSLPAKDAIWFTPLSGSGSVDGEPWAPGQCWLLDGDSRVTIAEAASVLVAGEKR
jgi:mannose-6-phosphate isomerase